MFHLAKNKKKIPQDLKEVLTAFEKLSDDFSKVSQELVELKELNKKNLQKVGVVRFNPFKEGGGDQSFSIAVLDEANNGFVITSLYINATNRVYAKPIEKGTSSYSLSQEEKEAINKAMNI